MGKEVVWGRGEGNGRGKGEGRGGEEFIPQCSLAVDATDEDKLWRRQFLC